MQTTSQLIGVGAGEYSVTVIDANGCDETANIEIGGPDSILEVRATATRSTCRVCDDAILNAESSGGSDVGKITSSVSLGSLLLDNSRVF